jgi:hypothetical protein
VSQSHRNPLATQVTVWRGNASRGKLREASASSMGIRAVRSESSCGQPCEGTGVTPDQRPGAAIVVRATGWRGRAPERSSDLCGGASVDVSGNRSVDVGFGAQVTRAAGAPSPLGKLGGAVALLFGCPVRIERFLSGQLGGNAAPARSSVQ